MKYIIKSKTETAIIDILDTDVPLSMDGEHEKHTVAECGRMLFNAEVEVWTYDEYRSRVQEMQRLLTQLE